MMLYLMLKKIEPKLNLPIRQRLESDPRESIGRRAERSQDRHFVAWLLQTARKPLLFASLNRDGIAFTGPNNAPELTRYPV